ncbi:ATP-binding protein [Kitasatospora sp. NPDC096147]|uniref:ATP-binding protein n=1 Tax=Kitasatospora sp. NPDC096147 TaxID=3364093 RepID=UPI00382C9C94
MPVPVRPEAVRCVVVETDGWLSQREVAAEQVVEGAFDLSACVREEIHLLGGVQSYGTLLAVDPATGLVDTAAANAAGLLGHPGRSLPGVPAEELLGAEQYAEARAVAEDEGGAAGVLPMVLTAGGEPWPVDVTVHRTGGLLVLEFEPRAEPPFRLDGFYRGVRQALNRLRKSRTVLEACAAAVHEMRELTGFDRVVAYRFDGEDGPGEVLAEDAAPGREPWLGLWFPATDIPPQARRLYRENWIRVIGDVDDPTVGLEPPTRPATGRPLDLSGSVLRTVSGFHLEYLRNIGVRSSMSVSILFEDRLWGLIACHGDRPNRLSPELRAACEFFGIAFSMQLAAIAERERSAASDAARAAVDHTCERLSTDLAAFVHDEGDALRELVAAQGVVLYRDGVATGDLDALPGTLLATLAERAAAAGSAEVWSTDRLLEDLYGADGAPDPAGPVPPSGVMLAPLGGTGDYLLWYRGERAVTRRWAADPQRPVNVGSRGERLTPRGSSAVFEATVRGRSEPWRTADLVAARELGRTVAGRLLAHTAELTRLNAELARFNEDLDSFAHAAAHDLKEPLRGIANAAAFMAEDAGDRLDGTSRRRLATVQRLATRMDDLLNSLLHFARLGRAGLRPVPVALDEALDEALEVAGPRLAEQRVTVVRPPALPELTADRDRLHEVLVNLLVNAAKYAADGGPRTVELAVAERVPPGGTAPVRAVVVRDNGIGIPADQQQEVFELFRRLHHREERGGGSGVGLAVVKRIVERHGGLLWLDSEPGRGTEVWFTLGG